MRPERDDTKRGTMDDRIDELLHLIDAEPDGLRAAEFLQAQELLQSLVGKTIAEACRRGDAHRPHDLRRHAATTSTASWAASARLDRRLQRARREERAEAGVRER